MTIKIADQFELWPVSRLKRYERNSRIHTPDQVRGIAASIRQFGFLAPIVVDTRRDRIAAGQGRAARADHDRRPALRGRQRRHLRRPPSGVS